MRVGFFKTKQRKSSVKSNLSLLKFHTFSRKLEEAKAIDEDDLPIATVTL